MSRPQGGPATELDGILVLAKAPGPTSHDLVALVRRLTGVRRVGHGGTLDPFAAGVLPIFLGRATRLAEYHSTDEKAYRAVVAFGASSTTDDLEGELTPSTLAAPDRDAVEAALPAFRGSITQVPPDYSAVRLAGRHAYDLARHGERPELRPRDVEVRSLELMAWEAGDGERPTATLQIRCSAGTYIRALARDLGVHLGSGAYLVALTRTASGPFRLDDAHEVDAVREAANAGRMKQLLLPPDAGLDAFPRVTLAGDELAVLARGQTVRPRARTDVEAGALLRVVDAAGRLAAIARAEGGRLHPEKVFIAASS